MGFQVVYFFWPHKAVPEWLEAIRFSGKSTGAAPYAHHAGFGFVINRSGVFVAHILLGYFIAINGAGMSVTVHGGGKGVYVKTLRFF